MTYNNTTTTDAVGINNAYCQHRRSIYQNLDPKARIILSVLFAPSGIIGILCNSLVVYCIHKTRQLNLQSMNLLRNFSALDITTSSVNFVFLKVILDPYAAECRFYYAFCFLRTWAIYSSFYMVPVTGFDRYIHIQYSADYGRVFTPLRKNAVLVLYLACVLYLSITSTVTRILNGPHTSFKYTMPLNVFIFLATNIFYLRSMLTLKTHAARTNIGGVTSSSRRSIIKITAVYYYFYLVSSLVLLTHPFLAKWMRVSFGDSSILSIHRLSSSFISTIASISSAVALLWINTKSRNCLKSLFLEKKKKIQHIQSAPREITASKAIHTEL